MSGQGYHLAISEAQADELLGMHELDVTQMVDDMLGQMEASEPSYLHGGYKDWNILLLCLTDGTYAPQGGTYPLNQCFFGGKLLVSEGSVVNVLMPRVVQDAASALAGLSREWVAERLISIFREEVSGERYTDEYYEKLRSLQDFYRRAADAGRAIVFYTDDGVSDFADPH
jgi:hypothetical protein